MTRTELVEAFRQAEASLSLEGLDPTESEQYNALKARVIAGELSFDEARVIFTEWHRDLARKAAAAA